MGDNYEVQYWDYDKCEYVSVGYYHYFFKAKRVAKKYAKKYYCISILIRTKK